MVTSEPTTLLPVMIGCDDMALLAARYGEGAMLCINPDDVAEAVEIVCKRDVVTPSPETIGLEDLLLSIGIIWFFASFW